METRKHTRFSSQLPHPAVASIVSHKRKPAYKNPGKHRVHLCETVQLNRHFITVNDASVKKSKLIIVCNTFGLWSQ